MHCRPLDLFPSGAGELGWKNRSGRSGWPGTRLRSRRPGRGCPGNTDIGVAATASNDFTTDPNGNRKDSLAAEVGTHHLDDLLAGFGHGGDSGDRTDLGDSSKWGSHFIGLIQPVLEIGIQAGLPAEQGPIQYGTWTSWQHSRGVIAP